jgi:HTH-type transcriptional regulator/antitoxin HigA
MTNNNFQPDWVSAPGDTMFDILEERNLSPFEFAQRLGHTPEYAHGLLCGQVSITTETARQLKSVLGGSTAFWITREAQYREDLARLGRVVRREDGTGWLSELPLKDMIRFGWVESIPGTDAVSSCLSFFGVPDVAAWRETYRDVLQMAAFRKSPSFASQPGAVAAWIRQGEIESASIECKPWDAKGFEAALPNIRSLTRQRDPELFIPELRKLCSDCGVAVVILRSPAGCPVSGATRFLSPSKALLLLSFRYLSDDQFCYIVRTPCFWRALAGSPLLKRKKPTSLLLAF